MYFELLIHMHAHAVSPITHVAHARAFSRRAIHSRARRGKRHQRERWETKANATVIWLALGPPMAVAGFLATALGDLIIAPIDTIKTLQQGSSGELVHFPS